MKVNCQWCDSEFNIRPSHYERGQGRFCSCVCRNKSRWKRYQNDALNWFWNRVDLTAGGVACWPWRGRRLRSGYGRLVLRGRQIAAHRIAYELSNGPVPTGLLVCHSCDNPPCCNPLHLWIGTHQDNMDDMMAKGRHKNKTAPVLFHNVMV